MSWPSCPKKQKIISWLAMSWTPSVDKLLNRLPSLKCCSGKATN